MAIVNHNSISGVSTISANTSITVGDTVIGRHSIGIGTTDTTGRNAGVGTATGTLIYNTTTNALDGYGPNGWVEIKKLERLSATGGTQFSHNGSTYHIFTSSNPFVVSEPGPAEVVVVAGGGGGGYFYGGGGGAGGVVHAVDFPFSPGTYTFTVGTGAAARPNAPGYGNVGGASEVYLSTPGPSSANLYARGGGAGGYTGNPPPYGNTATTGSAGGISGTTYTPTFPSSTQHPTATAYGNVGGNGSPNSTGGGGGGAGGAGSTRTGGPGQPLTNYPGPGLYGAMPSPLQSSLGTAWRDALGPEGYLGGGGDGYGPNTGTRPNGGGGAYPNLGNGVDGTGGGGSGPNSVGGTNTSNGGDGIIIVRY
jgi:hypothetical protein